MTGGGPGATRGGHLPVMFDEVLEGLAVKAQWLAHADEKEIADVLWTLGEERMSRRIARAIVAARTREPIVRTAQLAEVIASVVPRGKE